MIYQVNLISKDKVGTVTTTDVTDYIEQGFSVLEKLDETFDTGKISLVNTDRKEPYNMWDTIQVLIDGTEVASLRIAGDSISLSSKNPLRYTHELTLIEHTKLLELFVISGKTFTQPTDGTTEYTIADVIETLFRIAPLEIAGIVREAIRESATVFINEVFVNFKYKNIDITETSTISMSELFTEFFNKNIDILEVSTISTSDFFNEFKYKNIDVTETTTIKVTETFISFFNKNINLSLNATINLTETFLDQVNQSISLNETGAINVNETWYNNRPVEWQLGGSAVTSNQTCDSELDLGNVKKEVTCSCNVVDTYTAGSDLSTRPLPECGDGVTYTLCLEDPRFPGTWSCQVYACSETITFYTCELK